MSDIPEDIMQAAREALRSVDGELTPTTYMAAEKQVARALMAERLAERERCASEVGKISAELEFCRFGNSLLLEKLKAQDDLLRRWEGYGCPDCGGDCASANPPVSLCIMRETRDAVRSKDRG